MRYIWNILISIDQLANTLLAGDPDETLSSRMGKKRETCKPCYWLCRILSLLQPEHCEKSIEKDEGKDAVLK